MTEINVETKIKNRIEELKKERDEFIKAAQEQVTKLKNELDATMAQGNSTIAAYGGAIGELEKRLNIKEPKKE